MFIKNNIPNDVLTDRPKVLEELLGKAADYGKTSFMLAKLKAIEKSAEIASSFIPWLVVMVFYLLFMLFAAFGLSYWLGDIFGKTYQGFLVVAVLYGLTGIFIRLFMYSWLKNRIASNFIQQLLK